MKKKATAIFLAAALLFLLLPPGPARADEKLNFISINDTLPPELINCVVTYGGLTYVPYYTFSAYGLGVNYTYFSSASTAYLYTKDRQLFFELTSGKTYDGSDNQYVGSAILRSGVVYLPLGLMCRIFDHISYSYIAGNEYGGILRITTDAVVLNDAEFLQAAKTLMRSYYVTYNSQAETEAPAQTAAPAPTPTPAEETHEGETLTLSFAGAPTAETLDALAAYGVKTCFFLTAEDVLSAPDLLRRAAGEGHGFGVLGRGDAADFDETAALLFEAAHAATILLSPLDAEDAERCAVLAEAEGLVLCESAYTGAANQYAVSAWLESSGAGASLRLEGAGGAYPVLSYLAAQKYDIARPRETDQ